MDWLNDIGNSVGGFFGGLFGGNDEKKKQEEERRKQEALQKQQAQAAQKPATPVVPVIGATPLNPTLDMTDQRNTPLVIKRASLFDAPLKPTVEKKPLDAEGVEIEKRYQELLPSYKERIKQQDEAERSKKSGFDWLFHQNRSDEDIEKMARGQATSDYMYEQFDKNPDYAANESQSIQDILKENQAYFTEESKKANDAAKTTETVRRTIDAIAPFIPFGVGNAYSLIKAGAGIGMGIRGAVAGDDAAMDFTHYMMDAYAGINASDFDKMPKEEQDAAFFSAVASMPLDVFFSGKGLTGNLKAMQKFGLKGSAVELGKQFFDNPAKFIATSAKNIVKNTGVGTAVGSGVNVGARLYAGQDLGEAVDGMISQIPQTALNALKSSAAAEFGNRAEGLVGNIDVKTAIDGTGLKAQVDSIEDATTKAQVVDDIATKLSDGDATIKRQITETLTSKSGNLFDGKTKYGENRADLYRNENPETKAALNTEEINKKIAALPDDNYISQMSSRFGIDPTTVARLMQTTSKAEVFNLLNKSADFIKTAKSPDAAATSVVNKATQAGQEIARRYGMGAEQPKVETVVDAQGNVVNKATGEIITPKTTQPSTPTPQVTKTPEPIETKIEQQPVIDAGAPKTTNTANGFEQKTADFTAQIRQLADAADEVLIKDGSSWKILSKKIQDAYATKTKPELTPKEAEIYSQYLRPTLDKVLGSLIDSGQVSKDVGQIEWYMPQAKKGATRLPETIEDFYGKDFGYAKKRTGVIGADELDYGKDAFVDYVVRGSMTDDLQKQQIAGTIVKENPDADIKQIEMATEKRHELIKQIRTQVDNPNADANKIDSVTKLQEEAHILNIVQDINTAVPRKGLNADDALTSIGQMNNGFSQYRDAMAFAQGIKDPAELHDLAVRLGLKYVSQARIDEIAGRTQWLMDKVEPNEAQTQAIMSNAIRSMSVANVEGMIRKTDFIAPETRELVNREFNDLAISYNKAVSTTDKMMLVARRVMNSSMRDFNVNSALNEVNDIFNIITIYDNKTTLILSVNDIKDLNARWGYGDKIDLMDKPDAVNKVSDALGNKDVSTLQAVFKAADTVEKKVALYHLVEQWKSAVFLKSAEDFYTAQGFKDIELIEKVTQDYHKNYLPLDHFSRVISSDNQFVKLLTQYLDWDILKTRQEIRNLVGSNEAGKLGEMGRGGRIARNLAMNIAPKIAVAMVRGVPMITALGILDPIGVFTQDYTGLQQEDKIKLDQAIELLGISPILSLATQIYFNYRQDEEAKKDSPDNKSEDIRGDWLERSLANVVQMATPVGGQINRMFGNLSDWLNGRVGGEAGVLDRGYSENKNGRVQYLAPDTSTAGGVLDAFRGFLMGKNQTVQGREYAGNPDLISMFAQNADKNPNNNLTLTDWFNQNPTVRSGKEWFGQADANYNRPLSNSDNANYSDMVKLVLGDENTRVRILNALKNNNEDGLDDKEKAMLTSLKNTDTSTLETLFGGGNKIGLSQRSTAEMLLNGGREYNQYMDNLRVNNPDMYKEYVGLFDKMDFVNPEYWRTVIGGDANGNIDLNVFKTLQARKQQAFKDLGLKYDPLYDLTDEQARAVLQQKSTATGDDIALRNVLYKSAWYVDYMEKSRAFWDGAEKSDITNDTSTQRVKDWNALNTQLFGLTKMDTPELQKQFPYTSSYKAAQRAYEAKNPNGQFYGSPEATAWYAQYGNGYKAEQDAVDMANLQIINAMRKIEGFPEMSLDSYRQATEIYQPKTTGNGSNGNYMFVPNFANNFNATFAPTVKSAGAQNADFNPNTSVGRKTNSKITMKNY